MSENEKKEKALLPGRRSMFDIQQDVLKLLYEVESASGEITDAQEIALSELQVECREKLLSVAGWVKSLDLEEESVRLHKAEVDDRLKKLVTLQERLKRWIWTAAKMAGIIKGNERDGWTGEKLSSPEIQISWRRSEGIIEKPEAPGFDKLPINFPQFFEMTIHVTEAGGSILRDLLESGDVVLKKAELRKSVAADYLKERPEIGVSGLSVEKRIHPQIKA